MTTTRADREAAAAYHYPNGVRTAWLEAWIEAGNVDAGHLTRLAEAFAAHRVRCVAAAMEGRAK